MHSHYGINATSKMRLKNITKLLIDAHEKDIEELLWRQYALAYSGMTEITFETFETFKARVLVPQVKLDKAQIIKDAEDIKALDQKGGRE